MFRSIVFMLCLALTAAPAAWATGAASQHAAARQAKPRAPHHARVGKASIYARKFAGRKMADGTRMNPRASNAASKTLPLGTVAKVTNLENGKSTVVTIQDRGPHVPGRIVDLSPGSAEQIGLDIKQGLARVEVKPITMPPEAGATPANGPAESQASL